MGSMGQDYPVGDGFLLLDWRVLSYWADEHLRDKWADRHAENGK